MANSYHTKGVIVKAPHIQNQAGILQSLSFSQNSLAHSRQLLSIADALSKDLIQRETTDDVAHEALRHILLASNCLSADSFDSLNELELFLKSSIAN